MQHIFINCNEVIEPDFFTMYHHANGYKYQRIEDSIDSSSFHKDGEAVRVELYRNSTSKLVKPVLVETIYRG